MTSKKEKLILLSDLIAESYYPVHKALKEAKCNHFWLRGGRGSGKSSFVSLEMVLLIMSDPEINGVALRKVGHYLKDSVYQQLLWAIDLLGVSQYWLAKQSPLELIYKPTGQKILFRGSDKPEKLKSTKVSRGYIGVVWYEELAEFSNMDEIRSINQSLLRGGQRAAVFYTYNPPKSVINWVNREWAQNQSLPKADLSSYYHHSSYLDIPKPWLGQQFILEAGRLAKINPLFYRHEYLGEVIGSGNEVFNNLRLRAIKDEEIQSFDSLRRGVDWGYGKDPFVYIVSHYDKKNQRLYIFKEFFKVGAKYDEIAGVISRDNPLNQPVIADSSEPRSNDELKDRGINLRGAKKGAGSIEHGISRLQNLAEIVIDSRRCPNAAREFMGYQLAEDGYGGYRGGYVDKDNHTIDAVRYSLERDMRKGQFSFI